MNHLECMSNPWEVESHTVFSQNKMCIEEKVRLRQQAKQQKLTYVVKEKNAS